MTRSPLPYTSTNMYFCCFSEYTLTAKTRCLLSNTMRLLPQTKTHRCDALSLLIPPRVQRFTLHPIVNMSKSTIISDTKPAALLSLSLQMVEPNWMANRKNNKNLEDVMFLTAWNTLKNPELKYWPSCSLCCLHLQTPCLRHLRCGSGHRHHSCTPDLLHAPLVTDRKRPHRESRCQKTTKGKRHH